MQIMRILKGEASMPFPSSRLRLENLEARFVPTIYQVGPGHLFTTLHAVPWELLVPGDTVKVYYQNTPYHDKIAIGNSGTSDRPITVEGVANADGFLPVLDAAGAVENAGASYFTDQIAAQGVFTLAPAVWNHTVDWIVISGFEIENATRDNYFYNALGIQTSWNWAASAVALYQANHITVENCIIHGNENGLFGKSQGWDTGNLHDILVQGNTIYGNGRVGDDHYHNTYIEAVGLTYQFNHFGPILAGSSGGNVKDRSAGLVFRYNDVNGGAILLDLVEPEDGGSSIVDDPLFGNEYVYGNILYNPPGGAAYIVHFGGDTGVVDFYQRNLFFYDNTVVDRNDASTGRYRTILFECPTNQQSVQLFNNIFFNMPVTPRSWAGFWCIGDIYGIFHLGANWINNGYSEGRDGYTFQGTFCGEDQLITGHTPWFVDPLHQDFRLQSGSRCIGAGMPLPPSLDDYPVEYQYDPDSRTWVSRPSIDDLGAIE
jgi:hypothetical protein